MPVITKKQSKNLYQIILDNGPVFDQLTEEQEDIITYLAEGMTFREIAIGSECTKNHVKHVRNVVFRKLGFDINRGCYFNNIVENMSDKLENLKGLVYVQTRKRK